MRCVKKNHTGRGDSALSSLWMVKSQVRSPNGASHYLPRRDQKQDEGWRERVKYYGGEAESDSHARRLSKGATTNRYPASL